jgi:hypothetical protein
VLPEQKTYLSKSIKEDDECNVSGRINIILLLKNPPSFSFSKGKKDLEEKF